MRTQAAFALFQGAREIRFALVAAGLRIAGLLTERHPSPLVDGQPLFDYGKQVQHLIHELESAENGVVVAEDAHMRQEVVVSRLRTERDEKAEENYGKLVAARQGLDGLQGAKGGFETAFVSGTAPRNPKRLLDQLDQTVTLLNAPAVAPRDLKVAGFNVDYSAVATDLESGRLDLSVTVDQLDAELKGAEGTMLVRREAIDELRSTVIWAGRSAEGLFERAGEHELAKRIRTSVRRPLRPSEKQSTAGDSADSTSGESAEGESTAADSTADDSATTDSTAGEPSSQSDSGSTEPQASGS